MALVWPYVRQGAPFTDHPTDSAATFAAADANNMEDGILAAHFQPAVRVYNTAAQSIPHNTDTALTFNSERFDQAGNTASTMHDTASNTSRLTCRHAGVYQITGNLNWNTTVGNTSLTIRLNGTTKIGSTGHVTGDYRALNVTTLYPLAVNDYVELVANQASGSAVDTFVGSNWSPEFMMVRVG